MTEAQAETRASGSGDAPRTAGTIMREARQAQGLHIAALAAAIKVSQKKLELLEADRFDELPDATFARALAQTVCRALKIDPVPVLALLPAPSGYRIEQVGEGINEPFRDRPGRHEPADWGMLRSPAVWGPLLIVVGAAALYALPPGLLTGLQPAPSAPAASAPPSRAAASNPASGAAASSPGAASAASAASVDAAASVVFAASVSGLAASAGETINVINTMHVINTMPQASANTPSSATSAADMLELRARADSWIEVQDARSKVLMSGLLRSGETVVLDGQPPLRLKVGNARATEVVFRGRSQDLVPSTTDNVARLELK